MGFSVGHFLCSLSGHACGLQRGIPGISLAHCGYSECRSLQELSSFCRGRAGIPDHVGLFLVLCVHIISIFGEGMCDSLLIIAFQWFMLEMKVILQLDLQDMDSQSPQLP